MLSVEAQIKSILVFIFAPLFGLIADFNISLLFLIIGGSMLIVNFLFIRGDGIELVKDIKTQQL